MDYLWRVFAVSSVALVTVQSNYIIFQNHYVTRDNAQFCCDKYGMALLSIKSPEVNDIMENFIQSIPEFDEIWLGLFHTAGVPPLPENFYWPDGEQPLWTNWDNATFDLLSNNASFTENSTMCIKGRITLEGLRWQTAGCEDKIQYACAVNVNESVVTTTQHFDDADCPHLIKMTGKVFSRKGTVIENGVAKAETYGYFQVHNKIYSMGTQIGSYLTTYNHDCALKCVNNPLCDEVIIVSKQLCILYQSL